MFIDTNILVRHLSGDPADLAARSTNFLTTERNLLLTDLVVACAESANVGRVASFDKAIDRVTSVERVEPPPA